MTPSVYRPILLTRDGELKAVSDLPADAVEFSKPVFALHPTTKWLEDHVDAVAIRVASSAPGNRLPRHQLRG